MELSLSQLLVKLKCKIKLVRIITKDHDLKKDLNLWTKQLKLAKKKLNFFI